MITVWENQGFGSVSGSALIWIAGSGSRRAKMTHKNSKSRIFMFLSTGCSLLRAESFSCSLGVLYGGLGISKLHFWSRKYKLNFQLNFFFNFRSSNPGSKSAIRKNAGSGSVSGSTLNQCGSETLGKIVQSEIAVEQISVRSRTKKYGRFIMFLL